jgi:ferredoxin
MQDDRAALLTFFLTGRRTGEGLAPAGKLQPALFAGLRELGTLRYDFPVLLQPRGKGRPSMVPLSQLFDDALQQAAAGADGEQVRKQALRLEREIRRLVMAGTPGTLASLLQEAAAHVGREPGFDETRKRLRAALAAEGELADCDTGFARKLLRHLWRQSQQAKAQALRRKLQRLVFKLSALVRADLERSARGLAPQRLAASVGPSFASTFDFDAMSRLLVRSLPHQAMPVTRRQRIRSLLHVLKSQRFFPLEGAEAEPYGFEFDSCAAALRAWRERLPKLASLLRAMAMADLEVRGEYDPARHDAVFAVDAQPEPAELAGFPDYLVCLPVEALDGPDNAHLMELLSSQLPIKVLLQTDDLAGAPGAEGPRLRSRQLASLAMSLNTAYVLQASASWLPRCRERLEAAFAFAGPALFSVYSGADAGGTGLPPYLLGAAAMEARVFPMFAYDPAAGGNWAARFTLEGNPQVERDWPVHPFACEDAQHQQVAGELAFTAADFLAADARHASALACVRGEHAVNLLPVAEALPMLEQPEPERFAALPMIDEQHKLHQVVATRALLRQAARCRDLWHSLQELAGIHNSHAEQAVAQAERQWRERLAQEQAAAPGQQPAGVATAPVQESLAATAAAPPPEPDEPEHAPGEAYIETARCSTCNECVNLNPKMFVYDENQQARIADVNAGTYAQLVEAAENCQVAVIHPGKPRKLDEPGIEELVKRAEAFA